LEKNPTPTIISDPMLLKRSTLFFSLSSFSFFTLLLSDWRWDPVDSFFYFFKNMSTSFFLFQGFVKDLTFRQSVFRRRTTISFARAKPRGERVGSLELMISPCKKRKSLSCLIPTRGPTQIAAF